MFRLAEFDSVVYHEDPSSAFVERKGFDLQTVTKKKCILFTNPFNYNAVFWALCSNTQSFTSQAGADFCIIEKANPSDCPGPDRLSGYRGQP